MLLDAIGSRLRARRLGLGLTQAALAQHADVSQRFLVQLESGKGNISVQRLAAVCACLDLSLEILFRGLGPGLSTKLSLIGLRGAGKSTIGRRVAERLGWRFIELDAQIERAAGMSLAEIFEISGEAHYRELEARVLEAELNRSDPSVIATGGSLVTHATTWTRLRDATRTVWLRASPGSHLARVQAQGDLRPMAGRADALGELVEILTRREPLYGGAELSLDTDILGEQGTTERIVDWLAAP